MHKISERFDPESVEWRNYKDSNLTNLFAPGPTKLVKL